MDQKIKRKWVEALRSDKYTQTTGQLAGPDRKRCCLGVLCDLYAEEHEEAEWKGEKGYNKLFDTGKEFEARHCNGAASEVLPDPVQDWAGLDMPQGADLDVDSSHFTVEFETPPRSLSQLNDGIDKARQHDFDEIADLIERHL